MTRGKAVFRCLYGPSRGSVARAMQGVRANPCLQHTVSQTVCRVLGQWCRSIPLGHIRKEWPVAESTNSH